VKFLLNFIIFYRNFFSTDYTDSSDFRFELKKTSKTPLVMAEVYRPDVLSFRPVLKSELLHSPQVHHGFVPKLSPHSGKNIKKLCSRLDVCLLSPPSGRRG
jgi:hypothetical protein